MEFVDGSPASLDSVGSAGERASGDAAEEVDEHIVVAHAAGIVARDAVKGFDGVDDVDNQAGFFEDFATDGLLEGFAQLDRAARERPLALQRFLAAPDEENLVIAVRTFLDDNRANAGDGGFRVFPFHRHQSTGLWDR